MKRKLFKKTMAFLLVFALASGYVPVNVGMGGLFADAAIVANAEELKTPEEAVREMTWGVNLPDSFIADETSQNSPNGYCEAVPLAMGMGIWFWNGDYDWLAYYEQHDTTFTVSHSLPAYDANGETADWVGGLFTLGVHLTDREHKIEMKLSDSKIVKADGSEVSLDSMNRTYTLDSFGEPNSSGFTTCNLDIDKSQWPEASADFDGAVFQTTVTWKNIVSPEEGNSKVDYYYQLNRYETDFTELLNVFLEQGVNVVRLPVTWTPFTKNDTFEIDEAWLEAVKREVDEIISRGAYCILDMHNDYLQKSFVGDHWEEQWMDDAYKAYVDARFAAVWTQIAEYFKDYPQKLIFEPFNEPTGGTGNFSASQASRINDMNELFVQTVRKTGGNNAVRFLCLTGGNYSDETWLSRLVLPDDDYLMVDVHSYDEMERTWEPANANFDYKTETDDMFEMIDRFVKNTGVPVIIGEVGVTHRESEKIQAERVSYFFEKGGEYGVPGLWWEDSFAIDTAYWLYDKPGKKWGRPLILQAITDSLEEGGTPEEPRDISTCSIVLETSSYSYDGTAKTPAVTVKDGATALIEGTDYTAAYSDNRNVGTALITITGIGKYSGTVTRDFTIRKAVQTVTATVQNASLLKGETTVITANGVGGMSYSSDNTAVATVDENGTVTAVAAGKAVITITAAGDGNHHEAVTTIDIIVKEAEETQPDTDAEENGGTSQEEQVPPVQKPTVQPLAEGTVVIDTKTKAKYKVTSADASGGTVEYTKAEGTSSSITIPAAVTIDGISYKVTSIAKNAFKSDKKIKKVVIGSNVMTISAKAFYGCSKLKTVTIGKNVTTIGSSAFQGCSALKKMTLPAKTTKIGTAVFSGCRKLKTLTVKSTKLTSASISKNAFRGLTKGTTVKVPKSRRKAYTKLFRGKGLGSGIKIK